MSSTENIERNKQDGRVIRGRVLAVANCLVIASAILLLGAGGGNQAAADTNTVGSAGAPPAASEQGAPAEYLTLTNSAGEAFQASLRVQVDSQTNSEGGKFLTTCSAKFDSKYPVRMLVIIALGNSIEKADLSPKAGGRVLNVGGPMADPSGQRVGFGAGIQNASGGDYVMQIVSTNAEQFRFKWQTR
jgi:hypothetical protein